METILHDLRYGLRTIRRRPAFAAAAIASLALGIGIVTTIFAVVEGVLLRPLGYAEPDRLVVVWTTRADRPQSTATPADFLDWRAENRSFEELAGVSYFSFNVASDGAAPERALGASVSRNFFRLLGAAPAVGPGFEGEEPRQVVLSDGMWRRRFAADPGVVGSRVLLHGEPYTVAGVMPRDFGWPVITPSSSVAGEDVDFWVAAPVGDVPHLGARVDPTLPQSRNRSYMRVVARLRPGATLESAQADMESVAARIAERYPESNEGRGARVVELRRQLVGDVRLPLYVLLGAGLLVLAIASTNVANLFLAHAASRRREMAVRAALGAGRWRLARQLLVESVLVALVAGAAGALLAAWAAPALVRLAPAEIPRLGEVAVDAGALGFTLAVSLATALVFGTVPAFGGSRADLADALGSGGRGSSGRGAARGAFVVSGVALALVLLVGAGLLLESFARLRRVEPGIDGERLLTLSLSLPDAKYPTDRDRIAFFAAALERVEALPGVESAGTVLNLPLGGDDISFPIRFDGRPEPSVAEAPTVGYQIASPGYFRAAGLAVREGRAFSPEDREGAPPVAVVSESAARRFWPGGGAVGSRIQLGGDDEWLTVVGVVEDVRHQGLDAEPRAEAYVSALQRTFSFADVVVKARGEPEALAPAIRAAVAELDPAQPVARLRTMEEVLAGSVADRRFTSLLVSFFGLAALLLAAVGIYGVVAYMVAQRAREIGIRMALGATRRDVLALVVGHGLRLALVGAAVGLCGALAAARALSGLLYGVSPTDPLAYAAVSAAVVAVALLAAWVPARRASRLDPAVVLRSE